MLASLVLAATITAFKLTDRFSSSGENRLQAVDFPISRLLSVAHRIDGEPTSSEKLVVFADYECPYCLVLVSLMT